MNSTALAAAMERAGIARSTNAAVVKESPPRVAPTVVPHAKAAVILADYQSAKDARKIATDEAIDADQEDIDPTKLTMLELEAEITSRQDMIADIETQLRDDEGLGFARGSEWRVRARSAIRWKVGEIRRLEFERKQRWAAEADRNAEEWRIKHDPLYAQQQAAKRREERRAEHDAYQAEMQPRLIARGKALQAAALEYLGDTEFQKVLQRARELSPNLDWDTSKKLAL